MDPLAWPLLETAMNHLKHALRQLILRPGLSVTVIVMLALGIGATTAMFSLYHQILVRPLPVPEPERLVNFATPGPKAGGTYGDLAIGNPEAQFSYPMFRDLEAQHPGFTGIAGHTEAVANLSFREQPTYGRTAMVSGGYFGLLNLRPALGRLIAPEDEPQVGESAVVVLSHHYWQRRFGGDPNVLGELLTVNGQELEIIGVAPEGFTGTILGTRMDVFVPLSLRWLMAPTIGPYNPSRFAYWVYAFGRLEPGVTLERAAAELNGVYSGILNEVEAPLLNPAFLPPGGAEQFRARQIAFSPGNLGWGPVRAQAARPLELLLGVTALVLLIVSVNIANLLLARGASRTGEVAIRAAIGASRGVLVRQLLAESFVLIALGGLASLLVATLIVSLISSMLPTYVELGLASLSPTAMLFAAATSLATVLVFGLVPAWRGSNANPGRVMNMQGARGAVSGRGSARFRTTLMTAQIAFSMVLLVLAGLFTQSLLNLSREDLGVDVDSIVNFGITAQLSSYDQAELGVLYDRIEETLSAQPGVRAVGTTAIPLFYDFSLGSNVAIEGVDAAPGADRYTALTAVGSGYFDALDVALLDGRVFASSDTADRPRVAIVNQAFVRKFNLGDDAVGKRIGGGQQGWIEIVGVVADTKHGSVKGDLPPLVYLPRHQAAGFFQSLWAYVRADIDAEALKTMVARVMAELAPDVPLVRIQTMRERLNDNVYIDRLLTMLSTGFAALATLLAGIGLYGVLAYNVTQRTRELGLRLALGAKPQRLRAMVLKQVGAMALIGAGIGLAAAFSFGRAAEAVLFGLSARDPAIFVAATALLAAVVLAASWLPAWRASRIAPTEALRYE